MSTRDLFTAHLRRWLALGVDVKSVKKMLGHTDIQTTMRYVHYVEDHAINSVIHAQKREQEAAATATANK